jgi:hypothetical protein
MPPELDHGGKFATILERPANGCGRGLVDAEHSARMGTRSAMGKPKGGSAPAGSPRSSISD